MCENKIMNVMLTHHRIKPLFFVNVSGSVYKQGIFITCVAKH